MTISNTKSFAEILAEPNSRLGRLIQKAKQLGKITKLFRAALNSELTNHCNVGGYDGKTLSLVVDSAAWATQLRYTIPDLIKTLKVQPEFKNLEKISFKIQSRAS